MAPRSCLWPLPWKDKLPQLSHSIRRARHRISIMSNAVQNAANHGQEPTPVLPEADGSQPIVTYKQYGGEEDLWLVMNLIDNELSEPYSIFTYRYFLHKWPKLCILCFDGNHCFGVAVSKMDVHREKALRGYVAMLTVEKKYRLA
jgi:hypothetical protein